MGGFVVPDFDDEDAVFVGEVFADGVEVAGWQLTDEVSGAEEDLDEVVSFAGVGGEFALHSVHGFS